MKRLTLINLLYKIDAFINRFPPNPDNLNMKKRNIIILSSIVAVLTLVFIIQKFTNPVAESSEIFTEVKRGVFRIEVTTAGELDAKNSVEIQGA
ncbi:MAG: hypothetical protein U5K79_07945 [Cyclobacteriaceae bacterium]|nr:hypothetical protein [Cyclobacteriaceae bacterium]